MEMNADERIEFIERELNLSHALLDVAGPKPLTDLIAKARLGYENAILWIGNVPDPMKLLRITAKLDRLKERLAGTPGRSPSVPTNLRLTGVR